MRITVAVAIACLGLVAISAAFEARAAFREQTNIPAQGLGPALQTLARDRNLQLIYATDEVDELRTRGAVGDLTADQALIDCYSIDDITNLAYQFNSNAGGPWLQSGHTPSWYYHAFPPGARSCAFPPNRISTTANSNHNHTVNVMMFDGAVHTISYTVDLALWRAQYKRVDQLVKERAVNDSVLDETRNKLGSSESARDEMSAHVRTAEADVLETLHSLRDEEGDVG